MRGDHGGIEVDDDGPAADVSWSGACTPADVHTLARAAALAVSIAANAANGAGASAAGAVMVCDTVGFDATAA